MLAIKLKRIGKKHQPAYRVIVTEKRHKLVGRYVEDLGWFNPIENKQELNKDRIAHWIKVGAQPTDTVHNLLVKAGISNGKKIAVHKKPKAKDKAGEAAPAAEAPKAA